LVIGLFRAAYHLISRHHVVSFHFNVGRYRAGKGRVKYVFLGLHGQLRCQVEGKKIISHVFSLSLSFSYNESGSGRLSLEELKVMMEKLKAPQTHLGLKEMIKVGMAFQSALNWHFIM
jgi:hypothetical protein